MADVCDKGLSAAMFMALIRTLLRYTAEHAGTWDGVPVPMDRTGGGPPPVPVLSIGAGPLIRSVTVTNRYLTSHHRGPGYFVTLFFGVLDPVSGALLFINA